MDRRHSLLQRVPEILGDRGDSFLVDPLLPQRRGDCLLVLREPDRNAQRMPELGLEHEPHQCADPVAGREEPFGAGRVAAVGERGLDRVQDHVLQRVGLRDLFWRDFVPPPVILEIRDEPAQDRSGAVLGGSAPAAGRGLRLRIAPGDEQVPIGLDVRRAGQHAAHPRTATGQEGGHSSVVPKFGEPMGPSF